jgi:hypothetical protein
MGAYFNWVSGLCRASLIDHGLRVSEHFLNGSVACEDAAQAVLAQRNHSKLDRFCLIVTVGARSLINSRIGSVILRSS